MNIKVEINGVEYTPTLIKTSKFECVCIYCQLFDAIEPCPIADLCTDFDDLTEKTHVFKKL